jgi:hypothetical protein
VSDVKFNAGNQGVTFYGGGEAIWGTSDRGVSVRTNNTERMKVRNDGNVAFTGRISTSGMDPNDCPAGWGCGVRTYDVLASSVIAAGNSAAQNFWINSAGNGNFTGTLNGNMYGGNEYYANGWYHLNGDTGGLYWEKYGGGWTMTDGAWIKAVNDKGIYTGGQVQAGSLQSNGRLGTNEYLQINGVANKGGGCSPDGMQARASDDTGFVQCLTGTWQAIGGIIDIQMVSSAVICRNPSNPVGEELIATCPAGYRVSGGGYSLAVWDPIIGSNPGSSAQSNAPQSSIPWGNNAWLIKLGGANGRSCFTANAVCVK